MEKTSSDLENVDFKTTATPVEDVKAPFADDSRTCVKASLFEDATSTAVAESGTGVNSAIFEDGKTKVAETGTGVKSTLFEDGTPTVDESGTGFKSTLFEDATPTVVESGTGVEDDKSTVDEGGTGFKSTLFADGSSAVDVSVDNDPRFNITEEDITCKLCRKHFTDPKLLACLHTYCNECLLHNVQGDTNSKFTCPQCMHEVDLNEKGAFAPDVRKARLQKLWSYLLQPKNSKCVVCDMKGEISTATHTCLDCSDTLCDTCGKGHNSSTSTVSHRVVSLQDIRERRCDDVILRTQNMNCDSHRDETYSVFCYSCNKPLCVSCVLSSHRDHQCERLDDAIGYKNKVLSAIYKSTVVALETDGRSTSEVAREGLTSLEANEVALVKEVNDVASQMISKVKSESRNAIENVRDYYSDERKYLETLIRVDETESAKRDHILQTLLTMLDDGGVDVLLLENVVRKSLQILSASGSTVDIKPALYKVEVEHQLLNDKAIFKVHEVSPTSKDCSRNEGNTQMTEIKPDEEEEMLKPNSKQITANVQWISEDKDKQMKPKSKLLRSFHIEVSTDMKEPIITTIHNQAADKCLVMDKENGRLKIFKHDGSFVYLVNIKGKCKVFDQFIHIPDGDLICTVSNGNLQFMSRHLQHVQSIVLNTNSDDVPIVSNYGADITVGNLPGNAMRVFNTSGAPLRTWTRKATGVIRSMRYAGQDKVVMVIGRRVVVESEKEGVLLEIALSIRPGTSRGPQEAVVGPNGLVIVTFGTRDLLIFSKYGHLLDMVNTEQDGVLNPRCLFVGADDNVFVSGNGGIVAVYAIPNLLK